MRHRRLLRRRRRRRRFPPLRRLLATSPGLADDGLVGLEAARSARALALVRLDARGSAVIARHLLGVSAVTSFQGLLAAPLLLLRYVVGRRAGLLGQTRPAGLPVGGDWVNSTTQI